MKFRIAMLLLALAAILVAAGCNDSNYSADAAETSTSAVETVAASGDTDLAPPAAAEAKEGGCSSCSGCAGDKAEKASKDGVETTDASMTEAAEGKTCHDGSSCEGKDGVHTTKASADADCCGTCGGSCEGKSKEDCEGSCDDCPEKSGVETTKAGMDAEGKDCGGCEDDTTETTKSGVETTKASNS